MQNSRKSAWLTPDAEDALADVVCRRFFVPDTPAFRESVSGALLELTHSWNWEQFGTMTPDDAAYIMLTMYNRYMLDEACSYEVPAPYWESDNDSEGQQAPENSQDWYGVITSEVWYEQLADWVIAGFLAIAASPEAAIQYVMYVPRARLAFRRHEFGSLIKIFLDGTEIFSGNTQNATPDVMTVDVMADDITGHSPPYTLLVQQASASSLQVIRKRLDPDEIYASNVRYNSGTDAVQYTPDGGVTWVDAPQFDPRYDGGLLLPPLIGSDVPCRAAANMIKWLHDFIDDMIALLGTVATIAMIANRILSYLELLVEGAALLFQLILQAAETISGIGATALASAFSGSTYDDLLCIFYCHLSNDGMVSEDQFAAIKSEVTATLNFTAAQVVNLILSIQGWVCLSNAGAIGDAPADCAACDCGWDYDLPLIDWWSQSTPGHSLRTCPSTFDSLNAPGALGTYPTTGGAAWGTAANYTDNAQRISRSFNVSIPPDAILTSVLVYFDWLHGTGNTDNYVKWMRVNGSTVSCKTSFPDNPFGSSSLSLSDQLVVIAVGINGNVANDLKQLGFYRIRLQGTGRNPFN